MIGQSNMAGRGDFGEVPPIVNPRCSMLRMGRWQPMSEPINPDRSVVEPFGEFAFHSGVGLAASFADAYANYFHEQIGLIPCADGGTKISQWQPGELLFDHAVMMTKLAMRTSTLAGILWHQGESDSRTTEDVGLYHDRFIRMYTALKEELGVTEIPFLIGGLGDFVSGYQNGSMKYFREVNRILAALPDEIGCSRFVSAEGLTSRADSVHFDSKSCRVFGVRYFDAYLDLIGEKQN